MDLDQIFFLKELPLRVEANQKPKPPERPPPLRLKLQVKSLLDGDKLKQLIMLLLMVILITGMVMLMLMLQVVVQPMLEEMVKLISKPMQILPVKMDGEKLQLKLTLPLIPTKKLEEEDKAMLPLMLPQVEMPMPEEELLPLPMLLVDLITLVQEELRTKRLRLIPKLHPLPTEETLSQPLKPTLTQMLKLDVDLPPMVDSLVLELLPLMVMKPLVLLQVLVVLMPLLDGEV
jgi:hypothetical protein